MNAAKSHPAEPSAQNAYLDTHAARLLNSFRYWTGRDLLEGNPPPNARARELFHARFAVLSHDNAPDPILNYANRTGLRLFELGWDELIVMPSRLTAQAPEQAERALLLSQVSARGYISDYRGIRITKSSRRFIIERATVWNLVDENGTPYGQAAAFSEWRFFD